MHLQFSRKEELAEQLGLFMESFPIDDSMPTDWTMKAPGIEGIFKYSGVGPGISFSRVSGDIKDSFGFRSRTRETAMIEVGICLEGVFKHDIKGQKQDLMAYPKQCTLSFIEGELDVNTTLSGTQDFHLMEIHLTPEIFDSCCSQTGSCLPSNVLSFKDGNFRGVKSCSCIIPTALNAILNEILLNSSNNAPPEIMEEYCLAYASGLISFLSGGMQSRGTILCSRDIDRIREARRILAENLECPPNLLELSHHVGLNDYKLKTGFRQAYGKTMHQVLTELRLKKAGELIISEKGTIAEAALASGFRNPGDFSIAFKNQYGSSPRQYRKRAIASAPYNSVD